MLSLFLIGRGNVWREAFLATRPPRQADSLRRALDRMVDAVGAYIRGALLQAFVAGAQFENYVVQPRIQGHAVQLDPFLVVVAALFGAARS